MGRKPENDRTPDERVPPEAARRAQNRSAAVVCGVLLLAVLAIFGRSVGYQFVNFDDDLYVYHNPHLSHGLTTEGIAWALSATDCNNWHPLTWLSYLVDYRLYGLMPWGYHLTNVLLHAATAIALFLVLWRMTGDLWPSAMVAALFAVHPLRVESVAWVSERKDVLSGLFFMLTLMAYLGYVRHPFSWARYSLVFALFALGLMAKPMLVTLPFVLLLLDYWPLGRIALGWRLVVEKLPLVALSAASCVATSLAQQEVAAGLDVLPLGSRVANAAVSYATYLGQFFHPAALAIFYPHPKSSLPPGQIAVAAALLLAISIAVLVWRRTRPYLLVGWFWYLGMLVPVIGLVQVGQHAMANRYTYLPQIGLAIGLTWGAKHVFQTWPHRAWWQGVIAALVLVALMGCTWWQTSYWRDSETLWSHALECTPDNFVAHNNLGVIFRSEGRIDEAVAQYQQALDIRPNDVRAHVNLGIALYQQGHADQAIAHLERALQIDPDYAVGHSDLALALHGQKRFDEAAAHYQKAVELKPDYLDARNNQGNLLCQLGRTPEAIAQWREVLRRQPENLPALRQLAAVLATGSEASLRNGQEAVELAQRAAKLTGNQDPAVLDALAAAYAESGRFGEAIETAQQALNLASNRNNTALADALRARITLYQNHSAYHEAPHSAATQSDHP